MACRVPATQAEAPAELLGHSRSGAHLQSMPVVEPPTLEVARKHVDAAQRHGLVGVVGMG